MVIIYDCELTEPPSSVHCFRDVTLYSEIFLGFENLIKCPKGTRSLYWKWIKQYGAHDFVSQLLLREEEQEGLTVGKNDIIKIDLLNESNYGFLINKLKTI
jgi:hypothetical protein